MSPGWIIVVILTLLIIALVARNTHIKRVVTASSARLSALRKINDRYQDAFLPLSETREFTIPLNSKTQFDAVKPTNYLYRIAKEHEAELNSWLDQLASNKTAWRQYEAELELLPQSAFTKTSLKKKEEALVSSETLAKPATEPALLIRWTYTSPHYRNHYEKTTTFSASAIADQMRHVENTRKWYARIAEERGDVPDDVRYEVLTRDNYTCTLCGNQAKRDGVKMYVERIIPAKAGGKAEPDNLRTICERCRNGRIAAEQKKAQPSASTGKSTTPAP